MLKTGAKKEPCEFFFGVVWSFRYPNPGHPLKRATYGPRFAISNLSCFTRSKDIFLFKKAGGGGGVRDARLSAASVHFLRDIFHFALLVNLLPRFHPP